MVYSREQITDEAKAITRMESPNLCPTLTQEWQRLSKLIGVCVGLRHVEVGCALPKGKKKPTWGMIYIKKKDYHNKKKMNELVIIQCWEEIVTLFQEASAKEMKQ